MNANLHIVLKHMSYGWRDDEILGPVNWVSVHECVQMLIMDHSGPYQLVHCIYELEVKDGKTWEDQVAGLLKIATKERVPAKNRKVEVQHLDCGPRYR